ncbi:hypothetical protein HNQ90_001720 [Algibacter amylolyticus]|nr:hypothetical protein [Algibacter amylolyticus]
MHLLLVLTANLTINSELPQNKAVCIKSNFLLFKKLFKYPYSFNVSELIINKTIYNLTNTQYK